MVYRSSIYAVLFVFCLFLSEVRAIVSFKLMMNDKKQLVLVLGHLHTGHTQKTHKEQMGNLFTSMSNAKSISFNYGIAKEELCIPEEVSKKIYTQSSQKPAQLSMKQIFEELGAGVMLTRAYSPYSQLKDLPAFLLNLEQYMNLCATRFDLSVSSCKENFEMYIEMIRNLQKNLFGTSHQEFVHSQNIHAKQCLSLVDMLFKDIQPNTNFAKAMYMKLSTCKEVHEVRKIFVVMSKVADAIPETLDQYRTIAKLVEQQKSLDRSILLVSQKNMNLVATILTKLGYKTLATSCIVKHSSLFECSIDASLDKKFNRAIQSAIDNACFNSNTLQLVTHKESQVKPSWHVCPVCFESDYGKTPYGCCGKCKEIYYCSTACQKIQWSEHKYFCKKKE